MINMCYNKTTSMTEKFRIFDTVESAINFINSIVTKEYKEVYPITDFANWLHVEPTTIILRGEGYNSSLKNILYLYCEQYKNFICKHIFGELYIARRAAYRENEYQEKSAKNKIHEESNNNFTINYEKLQKILTKYRTQKAIESCIPPYCIFDNKSLDEMIKFLPTNTEELANIQGFGKQRSQKYGEDIIGIILEFIKNNNIDLKNIPKIPTRQERRMARKQEDIAPEIEKTILCCVKTFNGSFGKSGIARILRGADSVHNSTSKEKYYSKAIQSEYYGCLKDYKGTTIKNTIDKLINEHKLIIEGDFYPIIRINHSLSDNSNKESLENFYSCNLKKEDSCSNTNTDINKVEEIVLECIRYFDGQFSLNGILKILTGYKGFAYIPKIQESGFYGICKSVNTNTIEGAINYLINVGIVENGQKIGIKTDEVPSIVLNREEHEDILKGIFNFDKFKDWQWQIIQLLLNKQRILSIQQTGGGKSLCFQYTGNYFYNMGFGTTIVFSPLQALMREQVKYLKSLGIKAECIISNKFKEENYTDNTHDDIYSKLINNEISILYIAPERLNNSQWLEYSSKFKIAMVVIDEAHCISTWGHDFRVDYRRIVDLVKIMPPSIPVLALTATANNIVADDIKEQVGHLQVIRGKLERKNLYLNVVKTSNEDEKFLYLLNFVKQQDGNGIVYAGTRANTTIYSDWLNFAGVKSTYYNAGLSDDKRRELEQDLRDGKYKTIISTNALGMGMDKKDVRFVVHTQMPSSLIAYYQEIGRAGRDGLSSNILLLYNNDDEDLQKYFIETSKPSMQQYRKTLKILEKESLGIQSITKMINTKIPTMKLILKDLEDKGNIERDEHLKYHYVRNMTDEDFELINLYKQIRYELYIQQPVSEKRKMLDYLLSNVSLEGEKVSYDYNLPFSYFVNFAKSNKKYPGLDSNQ